MDHLGHPLPNRGEGQDDGSRQLASSQEPKQTYKEIRCPGQGTVGRALHGGPPLGPRPQAHQGLAALGGQAF
eukprot:9469729-Alexandrium_andersonii.AAC.1